MTVANQALPLYWVSPTQIKALLPDSAGGAEQLIVHSPGGVSSPFTFQVQATAPAILPVDAGPQIGLPRVIRQKNGEVVNFTNPIHAKESIGQYGSWSQISVTSGRVPKLEHELIRTAISHRATSLRIFMAIRGGSIRRCFRAFQWLGQAQCGHL